MQAAIAARGVEALVIDDLTEADLEDIRWSGSTSHLRSVREQLRRPPGEVEYLAVRSPSGLPIAKGGIDYTAEQGAGTIFQLATREELQGLGIGTCLVGEAERRIRRRRLPVAKLSVETTYRRARAWYERLGYAPTGERDGGWEATMPDGSTGWYSTRLTDLAKEL